MYRKESAPDSHDSDGVIVEDSGDVFRREFVGGITDKQACFSDCTVAHHHASVAEIKSALTVNHEVRSQLT